MSPAQAETNIKSVKFITSASTLDQCPISVLPEIAFIGRSNVGKSSLINLLCNNKNVAMVSKTPGKTKAINFFLIDENWYLVDLPGYGYAKVNKDSRWSWLENTSDYLLNRKYLKTICVLIDSNLSPQKADLEFITWLNQHELNFVIVFTKYDKSTQKEISHNTKTFLEAVSEITKTTPNSFLVSTEKKPSKDKLLEYLKVAVD